MQGISRNIGLELAADAIALKYLHFFMIFYTDMKRSRLGLCLINKKQDGLSRYLQVRVNKNYKKRSKKGVLKLYLFNPFVNIIETYKNIV